MHAKPQYIDAFTQSFSLNPRTTALIPIDIQYASGSRTLGMGAYLAKQGALEQASYRFNRIDTLVVPNTLKLLTAFRAMGAHVIHVTVGSERADFSDSPRHVRAFFEMCNNTAGSREHEIVDELKPLPGETVINKTTMGAFASCNLEQVLHQRGITEIVFTGISTNNCVDTTAREAADRNFCSVLVADATGTCSDEMQELTLASFKRLWGRVMSTEEVIAEMQESAAGDILSKLEQTSERLLDVDARQLPYPAALTAAAKRHEQ
ncbi:MAG: cysteine hydrolase [Proteobacteria bacterium]|nr:cysteine hydrolase [Pseudomonadota bacterium]